MKKLFVAAPMLFLAGASLVIQSCGTGDQGGVHGGMGGKGEGGSGTGGSGTGGEQGTGGTTQGTGGTTQGTGGTTQGMGGQQAGIGGMNGMGGAGGSDVAKVLDGQMFLGPCLSDTQAAVCLTKTGNCPTAVQANAYVGVLTTDKTVTLGGTMGTPYTITLHVQGEVESKQYGGMDQDGTKQSPAADGFAVGGTPTTADNYNIYLIRVTNPGSTAKQDYFLNSLQPPGVSNHTTYGIDYTAKIQAQGGATIRLVAADTNCSMIKNCGPTQNNGNTCAAPIILANVEASAIAANPTFDFVSKPYNGQWIVLTVKGVTSP